MIRFKKLSTESIIPTRATPGSMGFDLHSRVTDTLYHSEWKAYPTGISMSLEQGFGGIIKPRSGLAFKYGVDVLAGVIDSDYRGELQVILVNHGTKPLSVNRGDRIAQLVVLPFASGYQEVESLDYTRRGDGGFGSTGR